MGYLEAAAAGCLWVVRKERWALDLIGDDWPLFYRKREDAVGKCIAAVDHYDELIAEQTKRLSYRHSQPWNLSEVLDAIGKRHTKEMGVAELVERRTQRWKVGSNLDFDLSARMTTLEIGGSAQGHWANAEGLRLVKGPTFDEVPEREDMRRHVIMRTGEWVKEIG